MRHYDVQMIGGAILHGGKIAEMRTGEGKTLVATLPIYLNALTGKGVHLVTVNDYLARRDAQWMGRVYHALGMTVGVIQHDAAFIYDPTYQAEEASHDVAAPGQPPPRGVPAPTSPTAPTTSSASTTCATTWSAARKTWSSATLHYAIVDEVDNILIDEARTPLIISGPAEDADRLLRDVCAARAAPARRGRLHDRAAHRARSDHRGRHRQGREAARRPEPVRAREHGAEPLPRKRAEGAVPVHTATISTSSKDGEIIIVDEFTGRMMPGRRYSEGLHQAIEAKEGVRVQRENVTLARITFQNYFRLYEKLGGMTGTAMTEADEFRRIYNLDVVPIPTHRPMVREDMSDYVFKSEDAKLRAVVDEIRELNETGRPVLVGTVSIEKSEQLAAAAGARPASSTRC